MKGGDSEAREERVVTAFASTDCPTCGGFVALGGQGRRGDKVQLTGACPNGHSVFFEHIIR